MKIPYLPVYKSIPCISQPPMLEPKDKFFLFLCKNFLEKLLFYLSQKSPFGKLTEKGKSPKSNVKSSEGTRAPKAGKQIENFTITLTVRQSHHMFNAQVK